MKDDDFNDKKKPTLKGYPPIIEVSEKIKKQSNKEFSQTLADAINSAENAELERDDLLEGQERERKNIQEKTGGGITKTEIVTSSAINDSASEIDHIGFMPYVQSLARMIRHKETSTPLTIGIYGPWGTGKSSFMIQLKNEINKLTVLDHNNRNKFYHVEFDAWKHQTNDKVWAALLQAIPIQLEKDLNIFQLIIRRLAHTWNKLDKIPKRTYQAMGWVAVGVVAIHLAHYIYSGDLLQAPKLLASPMLGFLFTWKSIVPSFNRMFSPLGFDLSKLVNNKSLVSRVDSVQSFTSDLRHIIKTNIGEEGRLIIYIDDLDRCSPSNVTEVIEALNVFLDSKQCVFVLGMDHKKVAKSIGIKYKEICDNKHEDYGDDFLRKIVQLPINLPYLGDKDVRYYSDQLLPSEEISNANKLDSTIMKDVDLQESEFVDISMPEELKRDLKESLMYLKHRSPRNIKRFLNKAWFYFLLSQVDNEAFKGVDPTYLGLWLLIYELYPNDVKSMKGIDLDWEDLLGHPVNSSPHFPNIHDFALRVDGNNINNNNDYWFVKYFNHQKISPYIKLTDSVDIDGNAASLNENKNNDPKI